MKTIIVNIPEKKEDFLISFLKKNHFKSRVLTDDEKEEMAIARWIQEGMESEEVPKEKVYAHLRKHGVNC
jgi:hypothetical protein